ncbi:MAG: hypothetical protein WC073_11475 [Sterolibacterium sp.]
MSKSELKRLAVQQSKFQYWQEYHRPDQYKTVEEYAEAAWNERDKEIAELIETNGTLCSALEAAEEKVIELEKKLAIAVTALTLLKKLNVNCRYPVDVWIAEALAALNAKGKLE